MHTRSRNAPRKSAKAPVRKPTKAPAKDGTADLIKKLIGVLQATQANNPKAKAKVQEWDPDSDDEEEESDESEEEWTCESQGRRVNHREPGKTCEHLQR